MQGGVEKKQRPPVGPQNGCGAEGETLQQQEPAHCEVAVQGDPGARGIGPPDWAAAGEPARRVIATGNILAATSLPTCRLDTLGASLGPSTLETKRFLPSSLSKLNRSKEAA